MLRGTRPGGAILGLAALLAAAAAAPGGGRAQERPRESPTRGWIGFAYEVVPPRGRGTAAGEPGGLVVVRAVVGGSPADRAGLRAGDTIVALAGAPATAARFAEFRRGLRPGRPVRLTVRRAGRERELTVVPERRGYTFVFAPSPAVVLRVDSIRRAVARSLDSVRDRLSRWRIAVDSLGTVVTMEGRAAGLPAVDTLFLSALRSELRAKELAAEVELLRLDTLRTLLEARRRGIDSLRELQEAVRRRVDSARAALPPFPSLPPLTPYVLGERMVAGAELAEVGPELGSYFGVSRGLLVTEVHPGTPAADAGLRAGDVIVEAGGREVGTVAGLRAALAAGRPAPLRLVRRGRTVVVTLPDD